MDSSSVYIITINATVTIVTFQVNRDQLVSPEFSSSTCFGREPLGMSETTNRWILAVLKGWIIRTYKKSYIHEITPQR